MITHRPTRLLRACGVMFPAFVATLTAADLRIGMIGTDTSHVTGYAREFNDVKNPQRISGARVVAAYKGGSPDVEASWTRVDGFARELAENFGVKIVPTIAELAEQVDAIMIESGDGRTHLAQARAVFQLGKPVFIDKPFAGTLRDAFAIARLARETKTPIFSSSSLRYSPGMEKLKKAPFGELRGAISYGPCPKEPHHPDLFWYGINPLEALYAVMGPGCRSVVRTTTDNTDVVTGAWTNDRIGVFYGIRNAAAPYRVTIFGTKAVVEQEDGHSYHSLAALMLEFFRTGISPVSIEETLEIFAFMEAADESKRRNGIPITLAEVVAMHSGG